MENSQKDDLDVEQPKRIKTSFSVMQFTFWAGMGCLAFNAQLLKSCSFDSNTVGLLIALNCVAGMIAPPIWGYVTDKVRSIKRTFLIVCSLNILWMLLLPASKYVVVGGIPTIVVMYPAFALFFAPTNSLLDSWTVTTANANGFTYSSARQFGSLGYAVLATLYTLVLVIARFGVEVPYIVGALILCFVLVMAKRQKEGHQAQQSAQPAVRAKISPAALFKNYYFVMFMIFNVSLTISSSSTATFMPYILENIGSSPLLTGLVGGLRALTEMSVMVLSHHLVKRFKLSTLLGTVGIVYIGCLLSLRFVNTFLGVVIIQCVQGGGFGLYLCSAIQYAFTLAPSNLRATAQSLVTTTSYCGNIIASLLGGILIGSIGVKAMLYVDTGIQIVFVLIYIGSFFLRKRVVKANEEPRQDKVL